MKPSTLVPIKTDAVIACSLLWSPGLSPAREQKRAPCFGLGWKRLTSVRGAALSSAANAITFQERAFALVLWLTLRSPSALLPAQNHFPLPHHLVIQPHPVLIRAVLRPHPRRTTQQPHPRRRLKHVRRKRAAVHIKLHTHVPRIRNPRNLVARIQHHRLRDQPHQYRPFSHFPSRISWSAAVLPPLSSRKPRVPSQR